MSAQLPKLGEWVQALPLVVDDSGDEADPDDGETDAACGEISESALDRGCPPEVETLLRVEATLPSAAVSSVDPFLLVQAMCVGGGRGVC